MKPLKRIRIYYYCFKLALYVAIAVLVFLFRNHFVEELKYFVGALALLSCAECRRHARGSAADDCSALAVRFHGL